MIDKFIKIFEGLGVGYGQFRKDNNRLALKVEGRSYVEKKPVTKELWQNHLDGIGPNLGIFPLTRKGTCKWGAIDIDDNNFDYEKLLEKIRKHKLPLIMFRSKSGRAHVYLFMKDFYSAHEIQLVMKKFAAKLGLADKLDRIYPMQTSLTEKDYGSYLNMPYYNQEETNTPAYKDDFEGATIEEFFEMYDKYVQTELTEYLVEEVQTKTKKLKEKKLEDFFLPCVKNCLAENGKIPSDIGRNDFLLHKYVWTKKAVEKGVKKIEAYSKMDAKNLLLYFNKEYLENPLGENEIEKSIFKSENREYKYLCKKQSIKKYCDASACVRNTCGINPKEAERLKSAKESLGQIVKYDSDPPIYYEKVAVKIEGTEDYKKIQVAMDGSTIMNKTEWLKTLRNKGFFPPISFDMMKTADFLELQDGRFKNLLVEPADEEASEDFEFKSMIYTFIEKMTVSHFKKDLLQNGCYVNPDDFQMEFKLEHLISYLKAHHIKIPANQLTFKLKHVLKARKVNGKVYDTALKKYKSCPTWKFLSDPERYTVQITGKQQELIEHDNDN